MLKLAKRKTKNLLSVGSNYPRLTLSVFLILFALFGGLVLWYSFAASGPSGKAIGDINNDGAVDALDIHSVGHYWCPKPNACDPASSIADINGDGYIDSLDGRVVAAHLSPAVNMPTPAAGGILSGTVIVTANDPRLGAAASIVTTSIQFKLDGQNLGTAITSPPYQLNWDSTQVSNGQHVLGAVALLSDGSRVVSANRQIVAVNNTAPGEANVTVDSSDDTTADAKVYTYSQDHCKITNPDSTVTDVKDYADVPVRAFRKSNGQVQLNLSNSGNIVVPDSTHPNRVVNLYPSIGSDLNHLQHSCTPRFFSNLNTDPSQYDERMWLDGVYTEDGQTIYALVHQEYHGEGSLSICDLTLGTKSPDMANCWIPSITLAVSTDGGDSFHEAPAPNNLVATIPYTIDQFCNSQLHCTGAGSLGPGPVGYNDPSNIIKKDGYYYAMTQFFKPNAFFSGLPYNIGSCLMRTNSLADPTSWRGWDGTGFNAVMSTNPYPPYSTGPVPNPLQHICKPIDNDNLERMHDSITFNTVLHKYLLVSSSLRTDTPGNTIRGVYYSVSDDLIHWSPRKLLLANHIWGADCSAGARNYFYPTLIDPNSPSRNFETSGAHPYLYMVKFNLTIRGNPPLCQNSANRDVVRLPLTVSLNP